MKTVATTDSPQVQTVRINKHDPGRGTAWTPLKGGNWWRTWSLLERYIAKHTRSLKVGDKLRIDTGKQTVKKLKQPKTESGNK
jgi:hypothetical protein